MATSRIENSVTGVGLNQWEFSTGWTPTANINYSNGDWTFANAVGATAKLRFQDCRIIVHGDTNLNRGIVGVSLDGGPETLIDLYTAVSRVQVPFFDTGYLTGAHILQCRVTGTKNPASTGTFLAIDFAWRDDPSGIVLPPLGSHSLANVRTGLANALRLLIPGLRVYDFPSDRVEPPAAVLSLPEAPYDVTLGGRSDPWTFPLWLLIAKADDKAPYDEIIKYLEAEGPQSIRAAIEADMTLGGACDTVSVLSARPLFATVAGTEFLAIEFTVEVYT